MAAILSPILEAARDILRTAGLKGMHVQDIAEAAIAQNKNMGLSSDVFYKKMQAALLVNLKLKSQKPTFVQVKWDKGPRKGKVRQGWYRLRIEKTPPVVETIEKPHTNRAFLGKAGEHAAMAELLFWGFNASIMTVDDGIDIVASKDNKFFHMQVKTATLQEDGRYCFSISSTSFKRHDTANVFYIFVLREGIKNEFIVIPSGQIKYFINKGSIAGTSVLSLTITANAKKTEYTLNGKESLTPFYSKFGEIT